MPEVIVLDVTDRCNLNCLHCNREVSAGGSADISLDLVDKILEEAALLKPRVVALSGGEPTLHGRFEELLDLIGQHDVDYTFTTNGTSFREIVTPLIRKPGRLRGITFSLDGASAGSNDAVRGDGAFACVLDAMELASRHGIAFGVNTVVGAQNTAEVESIAALVEERGADELSFILMRPSPRAVKEGLVLSLEGAEDAERRVSALMRTRRRLKIGMAAGYHVPQPLHPCRALGMSVISIDYNGYLRFCPDIANYRGAVDATSDIIADLNIHTLPRSLKVLSNRIAQFFHHKIDFAMQGDLLPVDYYPCWYCLRYFNKADCLDI